MPFTVSHIAAVIPGHRWLSRARVFTAAVIGSMVPDFGILSPWGAPARWETHSFSGLFTFCVPVGFASYLLTQLLIRPALVEVLPDRAYARLHAAQPTNSLTQGPSWLWVLGALLLGAVTHLVWDNFTHEKAYALNNLPILGESGVDFFGHPVATYHWLQLGSSVVGLAVVIVALALWLQHAPRPGALLSRRLSCRELSVWMILYVLPPLLIVLWAVWRVRHWGMSLRPEWVLASVAVYWMRRVAVSLLGFSALMQIRLLAKP